jgi:hypothetical protein
MNDDATVAVRPMEGVSQDNPPKTSLPGINDRAGTREAKVESLKNIGTYVMATPWTPQDMNSDFVPELVPELNRDFVLKEWSKKEQMRAIQALDSGRMKTGKTGTREVSDDVVFADWIEKNVTPVKIRNRVNGMLHGAKRLLFGENHEFTSKFLGKGAADYVSKISPNYMALMAVASNFMSLDDASTLIKSEKNVMDVVRHMDFVLYMALQSCFPENSMKGEGHLAMGFDAVIAGMIVASNVYDFKVTHKAAGSSSVSQDHRTLRTSMHRDMAAKTHFRVRLARSVFFFVVFFCFFFVFCFVFVFVLFLCRTRRSSSVLLLFFF